MHLPPQGVIALWCWHEPEDKGQGFSLPLHPVAQQHSPPLRATSPLLGGTGLEEVFQCNEGSKDSLCQKNTSLFKTKQNKTKSPSLVDSHAGDQCTLAWLKPVRMLKNTIVYLSKINTFDFIQELQKAKQKYEIFPDPIC